MPWVARPEVLRLVEEHGRLSREKGIGESLDLRPDGTLVMMLDGELVAQVEPVVRQTTDGPKELYRVPVEWQWQTVVDQTKAIDTDSIIFYDVDVPRV